MPLRWISWFAEAIAALCVAGCPGTGTAFAAPSWQAVLAAGDVSQSVFDNAVAAVGEFFERNGVPDADIHRLSARNGTPKGSLEPATEARLLRRIAELPARPGDRCLVFITSHGTHDSGLWLGRNEETLRPAVLAWALSGGCRAVPTVVIISSCYSGAFATGPMEAPRRIILTAARADRPSFGCQADRRYTFFDE
jgi:hypothetical protein